MIKMGILFLKQTVKAYQSKNRFPHSFGRGSLFLARNKSDDTGSSRVKVISC